MAANKARAETSPKTSDEPSVRNGANKQGSGKYPPGLIQEYQKLALKSLNTPLMMEEQARLQALMEEIAAIDSADPIIPLMEKRFQELEDQLEQIRQKAEALLAAQK